MLLLPLLLSQDTIDLIEDRMKQEGYASADQLLRTALLHVSGPSIAPLTESSMITEESVMDFLYESVPLREGGTVDVHFVKSGVLEMIPFERGD